MLNIVWIGWRWYDCWKNLDMIALIGTMKRNDVMAIPDLIWWNGDICIPNGLSVTNNHFGRYIRILGICIWI